MQLKTAVTAFVMTMLFPQYTCAETISEKRQTNTDPIAASHCGHVLHSSEVAESSNPIPGPQSYKLFKSDNSTNQGLIAVVQSDGKGKIDLDLKSAVLNNYSLGDAERQIGSTLAVLRSDKKEIRDGRDEVWDWFLKDPNACFATFVMKTDTSKDMVFEGFFRKKDSSSNDIKTWKLIKFRLVLKNIGHSQWIDVM